MVTASHNPPEDNGIKLFVDGEEYDRDAEKRVERRVDAADPPVEWDEWGEGESVDVVGDYRDHVADYVRSAIGGGVPDHRAGADDGGRPVPLGGVRVAVDCGNGMASLVTPQVLTGLGATVVALNANVDGHFPARESKPTPETLVEFSNYVADAGDFAVGIAHDGDADRTVVLDSEGEVVHEDTVLAILAEHFVRTNGAEDPVVVTTPNASARIDDRVETAGGRIERVRLGALHEGIASARDAGGGDTEVVFAGEPWKHVHPLSGGWIDGVASAATLAGLVARAGGLAPLRDPVAERPYRKVSVECPDDRKAAAMEYLETALPEQFSAGEVDTEYGVRVDLPDGSWVLVRPSGTEPYVRVYAESDDVDELVSTATGVVEGAVEAAGN
jgi:phosphomannomutase